MLLICMFMIHGTFLMFLTNIAYILQAMGSTEGLDVTITTVCMASAVGRFVFSYLCDLSPQHSVRVGVLSVSCLIATAAHFATAMCTSAAFLPYLGIAFGLAEGGFFGAFPVLVRNIFGGQSFGTNFTVLITGTACSYLLVFGPVFSHYFSRGNCRGAFFVSSGSCLVAFLTSILLAASRGRTWKDPDGKTRTSRSWSDEISSEKRMSTKFLRMFSRDRDLGQSLQPVPEALSATSSGATSCPPTRAETTDEKSTGFPHG